MSGSETGLFARFMAPLTHDDQQAASAVARVALQPPTSTPTSLPMWMASSVCCHRRFVSNQESLNGVAYSSC